MLLLFIIPLTSAQPYKPNIVGGEDAEYGEFPHIVSLLHNPILGFKSHFCGGSIYNSRTVITAAHCCRAHNPATVSVLAGDYHRQGHNDPYEQEVKVAHMLVHEEYNDRNFFNDICLVFLDSPIVFNEYVGPVNLVDQGSEETPGYLCMVVGWGATTQGGSMSNILQKAEVPIVSDEGYKKQYVNRSYIVYAECALYYNSTGDEIAESMLCAGYGEGGKDACQGDSGTHLTALQNKRGI